MPAPIDSQETPAQSNAQASGANQPTSTQRRVRELLSSASTHREQLLLWIAQSVARSLARTLELPMKGPENAKEQF
ncbi:MAG TPA: hypothetical protein VL096_08825 [Pirellulaceae bacterium]|nr:hypothetical protein [Pirellulaceae bacterium]